MLKEIIERETSYNPDNELFDIYKNVKENQLLFEEDSKYFKDKQLFITHLTESIKQLNGSTLVKADLPEIYNFTKLLLIGGFVFPSIFHTIFTCSKQSKHYKNWIEYKTKMLKKWIKLFNFIKTKIYFGIISGPYMSFNLIMDILNSSITDTAMVDIEFIIKEEYIKCEI